MEETSETFNTSMIGILSFCSIGPIASSAMAIDGPMANATVSFGEWDPNDPDLPSPTLNRLLGDPLGGVGNNHELIPNIATIKAGGAVNFIISGQHIVAVYDDGHQPSDINTTIEVDNPATLTVNEACATNAGGVISDSNRRIYRGPCHVSTAIPPVASATRRDGVEVVKFSKPGTYLVICARTNHFVDDGMFGYVRVLPGH